MKFSAQEEYGLRCLIQIARKGPHGIATIPELSRAEGISPAHTAKILALLKRDGFVASIRGQAGGYSLTRPARQILIGDVLASLGGKLYDEGFCDRYAGLLVECANSKTCGLRALWGRIQEAVDLALQGMSLHDLVVAERSSDGLVRPVAIEAAGPQRRSH